jgi:hypothetical protein
MLAEAQAVATRPLGVEGDASVRSQMSPTVRLVHGIIVDREIAVDSGRRYACGSRPLCDRQTAEEVLHLRRKTRGYRAN